METERERKSEREGRHLTARQTGGPEWPWPSFGGGLSAVHRKKEHRGQGKKDELYAVASPVHQVAPNTGAGDDARGLAPMPPKNKERKEGRKKSKKEGK